MVYLRNPDKLVLFQEWVTRRMKNATIESMQSFCDVKTDKCGRQGHGKEHNSEDLPSGNRNKILGRNALLFKNKFKKV